MASEAAAASTQQGVASWSYEQLANVYHGRGDVGAERTILVRFRQQRAVPGPLRRRLLARLKTLEAARPRLTPPPGRAAPPVRRCAFPGCGAPLTGTQATYCSVAHSGAALGTRPRRR